MWETYDTYDTILDSKLIYVTKKNAKRSFDYMFSCYHKKTCPIKINQTIKNVNCLRNGSTVYCDKILSVTYFLFII